MEQSSDVTILRELAKRYAEIAHQPIQEERRDLWRRHNSLEPTRPLVLVLGFAAWREFPQSKLECEDPFFRAHETLLRQRLFQGSLDDDTVIEPWITQAASRVTPREGFWGVPYGRVPTTKAGGSWLNQPPLRELADIEKLKAPHHVIDEEATRRNVERLEETVGDILTVNVDRAPVYAGWHGDISTDIVYLRGLEQIMWDMSDNPEWLHRLLAFMRDGVLTAQQEAEDAGDWQLCNHTNQAQPYCKELEDPEANSGPVKRKQLWYYCAAQEFTLISPAMHEEFLLNYQLPIISRFGMSAYGCCEDLTEKIDMLRKIPNLRRIGVTPRADVRRSAEQIGRDYVFSWRPNPADMICCGFDPDHVRRVVRDAMEASKGCIVDVTLKDVQTVQGKPENLREWVKVVRSVTDDY